LRALSACIRAQVRDLLAPRGGAPPPPGGLRVREDPARGPYVEGLTLRPAPGAAPAATTLNVPTFRVARIPPHCARL
jgi:hypothetical protein